MRIYLVRPSPVNAPHSTGHRTYMDSYMHVDRVPPWTVKQSSFISWRDHRSSMSRRLGDWRWILQAPIGFRRFIHTSHDAILYAFGNHRNNSKTAPISLICLTSTEKPLAPLAPVNMHVIGTRDTQSVPHSNKLRAYKSYQYAHQQAVPWAVNGSRRFRDCLTLPTLHKLT